MPYASLRDFIARLEGAGKLVRDASPYRNHGTIHGSPRWVPTVAKPLFEETLVEQM